MRIVVVGGGLFGCTAAIHLARAGHAVHLYEQRDDLMLGATGCSFNRLHRGYHYPRDPATGRESRAAEASFRVEYGVAVIDGGRQFYVVPEDEVNHVTPTSFREFLAQEGLLFFQDGNLFRVVEPRINVGILQILVRQKVCEAGVHQYLGCKAPDDLREHFDHIVLATYANLNESIEALGGVPQEYRYQVVERPVVQLPERLADTSIVVVDGPYGCLDPLDDTPYHILGHVTKTIHAQNTGFAPEMPEHLADAGKLVADCPHTRVWEVIDDLYHLVPGLRDARYVGSSFVVRAVLAHQESTDSRPTLVERLDGQLIRVFSGKLGTACRAAEEVVRMIGERKAQAAA